jgi:peptidoglycan/LPS O-acetylase OafA/YrhL
MPFSPRIADLEYSLYLALPFVAVILATSFAASASVIGFSSIARSVLLPQAHRNGCLDGLRGLLALGVFMHHSFTAYGYFTRGEWTWSSSALFNHLGQSSVALFFMITAFLFSKRLLVSSTAGRPVGWSGLYISRFARLVPLYAVVVSAVVISVFALSDWTLREPLVELGRELASWYLFVVTGQPDINQLPQTWTVIAGVNWSLKYEWYFYFSLPLLYWPLRLWAGPKCTRLAIACFAFVLLIGFVRPREITEIWLYLLHFACGILAALIYQDQKLNRVISSRIFRVMAILAVACLGLLPNSHSAIAVGLTFIFFLAVLGGYSIGGCLKLPAVIWLGEISYGLYLAHGLIIFWTLHCLNEWGVLSKIDLVVYAPIVVGMAIVVVVIASVSYIYLEKPSMKWGKRVTGGGRPLAATV